MDERTIDRHRHRSQVSEVRSQLAEESVAISGRVSGGVHYYNMAGEGFLPALRKREPEQEPEPAAVYARICAAFARLAQVCTRASESLYRRQRRKGEVS